MEFLLTHATLKVPEVATQASPYWQTFHIKNGSGDRYPLEGTTAAAEVVSALPADCDGFWIGNRIEITLTVDGEYIKTGTIHETDGFLYIPEDRCRIAELEEVLRVNPSFANVMVAQGLSTALRVTNGFLVNDPSCIRVVRAA